MSNPNLNPESAATQKAQIRKYLKAGKRLTPLEALQMFGCFRLAAVVFTLKEEGLPIVTKIIRTDTGKKVAQYFIKPEDVNIFDTV